MQTSLQDQLIIQENALYFQDIFGTRHSLPNLTTLWQLYLHTDNETVKKNILPILKEDLGTLLVVEIMIDATHEVTLKRLETGEIQKNMKHVHDYYVIPKSHYALAKAQYENMQKTAGHMDSPFESCHFTMFPYGLAIVKAGFPDYHNLYTSTDCLLSALSL